MSPLSNGAHQMETEIITLGREIFSEIERGQTSAFDKNYWSARIMEWSMKQEDFKINMFRLVDVLPTLQSSRAVASHVNEYLSKAAADMNGIIEWGVNVDPDSWRAKFTAVLVRKAIEQMASQFIAGASAGEALKTLRKLRKQRACFTVDLLGEYCLSEEEAQRYLDRYLDALDVLGKEVPKWPESKPIIAGHPGDTSAVCVSVKLSALYSQCNPLNFDKSVEVLGERLAVIARKARPVNALLYVDAEDTANNPIIYEAFRRVFGSDEFRNFPYPGIVLQAYARSGSEELQRFIDFAKKRGNPIAVRLVKGAYWDHETIMSDQNSWPSPLFRDKESTDANYEKISQELIDHHQHCFPAFGSHIIRSLSHACVYARSKGLTSRDFELQMLFGMADPIAKAFIKQGNLVRFYVPLGETLPGMGYLIRRLLENTSNESFLRHTFFESENVDELLRAPEMKE